MAHGLQELEIHVTRPSLLPPCSLLAHSGRSKLLAGCAEAGLLRKLTALGVTATWDGLVPEVGDRRKDGLVPLDWLEERTSEWLAGAFTP